MKVLIPTLFAVALARPISISANDYSNKIDVDPGSNGLLSEFLTKVFTALIVDPQFKVSLSVEPRSEPEEEKEEDFEEKRLERTYPLDLLDRDVVRIDERDHDHEFAMKNRRNWHKRRRED